MSLATALQRPELQALVPYESARRIGGTGEVWLNANENPYYHEYQLDCSRFNRYPEFQPPELMARYAQYAGVLPGQLLCTRGADESIELLIRSFCRPGQDRVLICPPTYGMYAISAQTNGVDCIKVVQDDQYQPDFEAIKNSDQQVKLVFLCSPNNPTGHSLQLPRLRALLEHFAGRALVVVDEAYIEFSDHPSVINLLAEYDNLVVLRTLSKAFALAGIRCGFTIASSDIINVVSKVIAPYPIPVPVAQIAINALDEAAIARMRKEVGQLVKARQKLYEQLKNKGLAVLPSTGNFLLFKVPNAAEWMKAAAAAGIVLRNQSKQPLLAECLRITIGSDAEMTRTKQWLTRFVEEYA